MLERNILDVPMQSIGEPLAARKFSCQNAITHMAGWPRFEERQFFKSTRRSAVPLTGLAVTTKGARSAKTFRPNRFLGFFLMLGDKETGAWVTKQTLSIFMVDA